MLEEHVRGSGLHFRTRSSRDEIACSCSWNLARPIVKHIESIDSVNEVTV